jgi:hypothetical protein
MVWVMEAGSCFNVLSQIRLERLRNTTRILNEENRCPGLDANRAPGVKRPGREADHSLQSSAHIPSWRSA